MIDWRGGTPFSPEYQDVYYSTADGLEESRHVYVDGIRFRERIKEYGSQIMRVGELGFGTGLNFLATWQAWDQQNESGILHFVSLEKHPLNSTQIRKALSIFPEIRCYAEKLLRHYDIPVQGLQRLWLCHNVVLDLWIGDVLDILPQWDTVFHGWYLDGFSPKRNPEMFSASVCEQIARLSVKDTVLATFSVAGWVRRNIQGAGFLIQKRTGFAHKSECLCAGFFEASKDIKSVLNIKNKKIAVIGSGIAGASCAEQLARLGKSVDIVSSRNKETASTVPVAAVAPRFSATDTPRGRSLLRAYRYALHYYEQYPEAIIVRGAAKIPSKGFQFARLQQAAKTWSGLSPCTPIILNAMQSKRVFSDFSLGALQYLSEALVIRTDNLRKALLKNVSQKIIADICSLNWSQGRCILKDAQGREYGPYSDVVLACGSDLAELLPCTKNITRKKVGETAYYTSAQYPKIAIGGWGGHYVPDTNGFWYGDSQAELLGTVPTQWREWGVKAQKAKRRPWRAHKLSVDGHWPLCGEVPQQKGLYVLAGAGGHGFTLMPWLSSTLAFMIAGYQPSTEIRLE